MRGAQRLLRRLIEWWCEIEDGLRRLEERMTPEQRAYAYWLDRGGWL